MSAHRRDRARTDLHLDLTEIEQGHPTDQAELRVRVWLIGSLIANAPPTVMTGLIGFLAAAAVMVVAIMKSADLRWAGGLAVAIVLGTIWLVHRIAPTPHVQRRRMRLRDRNRELGAP
jgi:hypothetical protein